MLGRLIVVALVALALGALVRPARADEPSQEQLARSHYVAGEQEYARGRWKEALHEFQVGYALSPRPEFLINFAQVYRKLGDFDAAERECQRYLATAPPTELAQQAERLLQQIRDEKAAAPPKQEIVQPQTNIVQPHHESVPPPVNIVQVQNKPERPKRRWVVPVAVVGSVLVVGAAVTVGLLLGLQSRDSFPSGPVVDFR